MQPRIYIVEDNPIVREMFVEFLTEICGYEVSGTADDGETALEELPGIQPDLVLVDVSLPTMSGIDLVKALQARMPDLPCLMISGHQETTYVTRALAAGALGYVVKGDPDDIPKAVRSALDGAIFISPSVRRRMPGDAWRTFAGE